MERKEAIDRGKRRYITGRACINGHLAARDTLSGACLLCVRDSTRRARERVRAKLDQVRR